MTKKPKTQLEEILFCVESTNDIVSEILGIIEYVFPESAKDYRKGKKR